MNKQLHIVHTEASVGWGGQEIRILSEARGMLARGHRVTLLCPSHARIYEEAQKQNIPAVALPIGRKKLRGMLALRSWLKQNPVDVINTHSSTDSWLAALACATLRHAPPIVRTRHISAPTPNNRTTRWLYQTATKHIVTTGERLRQALINHNGYDPARITSVPTGIDGTRFQPGDKAAARQQCGLPEGGLLLGIIATMRSWKGHLYLLEAFASLKLPDARLLIVGEGPYRGHIEDKIAELGLQDKVIMPGNQSDVVPWLQSLDIFVLPSYANEGVPQAVLQAMFCGLPVVSTPVGSITEAVQDQQTGFIVEPKNSEVLAQAMGRLVADPALREAFGRAGREHVSNHFAYSAMLDNMERIFTQAAHGRQD